MAKVIVSREARNDLVGIRQYVREELDNPDAAACILSMLKKRMLTLPDIPERGTPLDVILSVHTEYRFIVCEKYCVFYLYDGETVEVVRVLHQMQDSMRALFSL
ncbi:MAG: type II toxin-antitoxin system RelE/ParE family toxin [Clostridia bacterium]